MRVLVSTIGEDDSEKVLQAMRGLPYDRLVLIGEKDLESSDSFRRIAALEEISGQDVQAEMVESGGFLQMVDSVTEALERAMAGGRNSVTLNVSGGSKLLGDAALIAAFRLGVVAYHFDTRITRLPVVKGATAKDRFTLTQTRLIEALGNEILTLEQLAEKMGAQSRQVADRAVREVKKLGLLSARASAGGVALSLSPSGLEVLRALAMSRHA